MTLQYLLDKKQWMGGFIFGLLIGTGSVYVYFMNPKGILVRFQQVESNQQVIITQLNLNTDDVNKIKSFVQKAVDEANKK